MMKIVLGIVWFVSASMSMAESSRFHDLGRDEVEKEFVESEMPLPPVPSLTNETWFDLYISATFSGKARILLDSIKMVPDGSVRYVLNNRSALGNDNITAEGLLCTREEGLLNPAGYKSKIFGFADNVNKRWIQPRRTEWSASVMQKNVNRVRDVIFETVCRNGRAENEEALRQRFRQQAGHGFNYQEK
ncbi:MAG: CNP1-like family protein [Alysiella sp.]|nr:CNP1-like family protein [Alysiella sp.]